MFITIKHGDQQEELFNPDCSLLMLVESIRRRCGSPASLGVAVADEKLNVVQLAEGSVDCASSLFADRGVYVLLAVRKRESGLLKYTVLLDDADPELVKHLDTLSNPHTHDGKGRLSRQLKKVPAKQPIAVSKGKKTTSTNKLKTKF